MNFIKCVKQDLLAQLQGRTGISSVISACLFARGFHLLFLHRIQKISLKIPIIGFVLAKIIFYITSCIYGCEISIYARLGGGIYIPHAIGIIIGENVRINSGVSIYQNVTIGTRSRDDKGTPIVSNNVYIGANSVVVGKIIVGENVVIGANSVVLRDVFEGDTVVGCPAKSIN